MNPRFAITSQSGIGLFSIVAFAAIAATSPGCKQNATKSTAQPNLKSPDAPVSSIETPPVSPSRPGDEIGNLPKPVESVESQSNLAKSEIDDMIRIAAGPMADSVNSSLARLNTNLGRKEHTLVIMAMKSETRRWYFLTHMVSIIDSEQLAQATGLIESYSGTWQDLLDRRARILESERDGERVRKLLDYNKVAALKLTMLIRKRILREVLSPEQRDQYAAQFETQAESAAPADSSTTNDEPTQ